jgi:hypothetical protein
MSERNMNFFELIRHVNCKVEQSIPSVLMESNAAEHHDSFCSKLMGNSCSSAHIFHVLQVSHQTVKQRTTRSPAESLFNRKLAIGHAKAVQHWDSKFWHDVIKPNPFLTRMYSSSVSRLCFSVAALRCACVSASCRARRSTDPRISKQAA